MSDDFLKCKYCGGDPFEPDHHLRCDGRQGGIETEQIDRHRESSVLSFYNAVNAGTVKTLQQHVYAALVAQGASNMMGVNRYFQRQGIVHDSHSITPRFAELRDLGFVREVGLRPCPITGQMSIFWEAIPLTEWDSSRVVVPQRCPTCNQLIRRTVKKRAS